MKKNVQLLIVSAFFAFIISCSGTRSESEDAANQVEEMKSIKEDAQETVQEIESETEQLEQEVDSLLREI